MGTAMTKHLQLFIRASAHPTQKLRLAQNMSTAFSEPGLLLGSVCCGTNEHMRSTHMVTVDTQSSEGAGVPSAEHAGRWSSIPTALNADLPLLNCAPLPFFLKNIKTPNLPRLAWLAVTPGFDL